MLTHECDKAKTMGGVRSLNRKILATTTELSLEAESSRLACRKGHIN